MTEFIMVGVMHDMNPITVMSNGLMDSTSAEQFRLRITPKITDRSVVFHEGFVSSQLFRPGMDAYEKRRAELVPVLGEIRPALGFVDSRWDASHAKRVSRVKMVQDWIVYANKAFRFAHYPETMAKLDAMIRADQFEFVRTQPAWRGENEYARHMYTSMRRFNRSHIEAMRKADGKFDTCVVIAGFVHAMALSRLTGYQLENLVDVKTDYADSVSLYAAYANIMYLPQALLGLEQRPAA
jgi:hypothetical protein